MSPVSRLIFILVLKKPWHMALNTPNSIKNIRNIQAIMTEKKSLSVYLSETMEM
jgi:hypothetical protein